MSKRITNRFMKAKLEKPKVIEEKMTDDEAKKLIRAAFNVVLDAVLSIIQDDPHGWSKRGASRVRLCQTVSSIIGKPFGCLKYQTRNKKGQS